MTAVKKVLAALDGLRTTGSVQARNELDVKETLSATQFTTAKVARHGFPYEPKCMAYDPVQKLLAIGTGCGHIRIFGCPGVDCHLRHESDASVIQMQFLINEGALVSACKDDVLHLWNFRQKKPEIVHSLQFQKEQITCIHLPFKSKWLYVGSERGNVHIVGIQNFAVSGYVINWNKAIDLSQKNHPGIVRHLSDCPGDDTKLLIGYDKGTVVLWNLATRIADARFQCEQGVKGISWHPEGKQFVCGHLDGSLSVWNTKTPQKPVQVMTPHARNKPGEAKDKCRSIGQVQWEGTQEDLLIFSGGLQADEMGVVPALTILKGTGKAATVLEMEHSIVTFVPMSPSPYVREPFAIAVLLKQDLLIVDLTTPQYPCFENPYPMDIHESPVTCVFYIGDCPTDLIAACYSHGVKKQTQPHKAQCSPKPWPITGGEWGSSTSGNHEMIITGHADGMLKFWDASSESLQVLYRLKTGRHMERVEEAKPPSDIDLFAITRIFLCPDSRWLVVAARSGYITLFKFVRKETNNEIAVVEILFESVANTIAEAAKELARQNSVGSGGSSKTDSDSSERFMPLKVRGGPVKRSPGYQPDMVCLLPWTSPVAPEAISAITLNSSYGLLAVGTEQGVAVIDVVQRVLVSALLTGQLFGVSPSEPKSVNQSDTEPQLNSPSANNGDEAEDPVAPPRRKGKGKKEGALESGDRSKSQDKMDVAPSRSRHSSSSSLEPISMADPVSTLSFIEAPVQKDGSCSPTLWVGTAVGGCACVTITLPQSSGVWCGDPRLEEPVITSPSGIVFRVKGKVLDVAFLDPNFCLLAAPAESWKESSKDGERPTQNRIVGKTKATPPNSVDVNGVDTMFVVVVGENEVRVFGLPTAFVYFSVECGLIKSSVVAVNSSPIVCGVSDRGKAQVYSLPSLRTLLDAPFLTTGDSKIAHTLCFSSQTQGMYMCSPCEIQKFTYLRDIAAQINDASCLLFQGIDMPEPPKQHWIKGIFGQQNAVVDREKLFGEESGKASKSLAKHIPGPSGLDPALANSESAAGAVARARMALDERGEKLGQVEDTTAQLQDRAKAYSENAQELMNKYKNKRWYQF